jgi:WD40 repeat protein
VFSPDGQHFVTAGNDPFAIVWSADSGKELRRLWGHQGSIEAVRFSADGRRVLTGSSDTTARLYDVQTGEQLAVFRGHRRGVYAVDFSPDGTQVVTSGDDGTTRLWQVAAPKEQALVLRGHEGEINSLQFSPDGKRLLTAGKDETPRLWDVARGREVLRIGQGRHLGKVRSAGFSADGRRIVTASTNTHVSVDGKVVNPSAVHVWGAEKGDDLLALKEHLNGALHARFSPDGKRLLTLSDGNIAVHHKGRFVKSKQETSGNRYPGLLRLWDAQTGKLLLSLKQKQAVERWSDQSPFRPMFRPDGRHLLVADEHLTHFQLVDAGTGKTTAHLRQEQEKWTMRNLAAAFSPDGRWVFTTVGGTSACVWDAHTGGISAQLRGFERGVRAGAFSPDSRRLVTLSGKNAYVWEVPSRQLLATLRGHEADVLSAAFSADGQKLVTGAHNGEALLWDVESGKPRALLAGHTKEVRLVAFSPNGARVATGSADGTARVWPVDFPGEARKRLPRQLTEEERRRYGLTQGPERERTPSALPEPGTKGGLSNGPRPLPPAEAARASAWLDRLRGEMAKKGADREKVRAELLALRRAYPGTAPALGAAALLARLPSPLDKLSPAGIPVENRFAGQPKELVAVLGERRLRHNAEARRVLVSKDGRLVISAADRVYLWGADTGEERGSLPGRLCGMVAQTGAVVTEDDKGLLYWDVSGPKPRQIAAVPFKGVVEAVSPDGKLVGTAASGAIRLRKVRGGQVREWAVLPGHRHFHNRVAFSADGKRLATGGSDEFLRVWALDGDKPRQLFQITGSASKHAALALSPDGNVLAVSANDGSLRLWGLSGARPQEWPGIKQQYRAEALAFSPDGKMLAAGGDSPSLVRLYQPSPAGLRQLAGLRGHSGWLYALAFSRDGKVLVSGGSDHTVRIWDLSGAPKERAPLGGHTGPLSGLAFAPDRPVLASNSQDGTTRLWDVTGTGRELAVLEGGWGRVAFSPDGQALAAGTSYSPLRLWDVSGARPRLRSALPAHSHGPFAFGFTGDGRGLVSGSFTPILRGWDVGPAKPRPWFSLPNDKKSTSVESLAVSPDGTLLVGGRHTGDRTLLAWRITKDGPRAVPFPKTEGQLVAISPDGKALASAEGAALRLWDLSAPVPTLKAEVRDYRTGDFVRVQALAFSPDGRWLASVSNGGRVLVSDAATGVKRHDWKLLGGAGAVAFAPDGRHLAVGSNAGVIYVLRLARPE